MQYSMQQGVQYGPFESAKNSLTKLGINEWLPVGIASITGLWLCLLMVSVLQRPPTVPGATSNLPKTQSSNNLAVSYKKAAGNLSSSSSSSVAAKAGRTSDMRVAKVAAASMSTSVGMSAPVTNTVVDTPIIGGYGGDDPGSTPVDTPTSPVTDPVTPITDPVVPVVTDPIPDPIVPVQLQITTPVVTIGADTSDGLDLSVGILGQ